MKPLLPTLAALGLVAATFAADRAPNVIFYLVDDLGAIDLACTGSALYQTPHTDRLAAEGMTFTQAYAAHPRCVPSRYGLITGCYPARDGVPGRSYNLDPERETLAEALKAGGYATFFAGKWHLAKQPEQLPEAQGFDVNIAGGAAGAPNTYWWPYNKAATGGHKAHGRIEGLEEGEEGEYLNDRLTTETPRWIRKQVREHPEQPFLAYLSHYGVHTPLEAPEETVKAYEAKLAAGTPPDGPEYLERDGTTKMRQDNAVYAAMVDNVDHNLGRILRNLEKLGIDEHTVVILTSDHGGLSNRGVNNQRPLATSNQPLRAGKGHCYEGGIRVPLIVRWPGKVPAGTRSDAVVNGTDHFPTLLELAGLPLRPTAHLDGVSYAGVLEDPSVGLPARDLFWHSPKGRPNNTGDHNCSVIRRGPWKLIDFYDQKRAELYRIDRDPAEAHDLAATEPERTAELQAALDDWKDELGVFIDGK